jgi:hypothetical protein
MVSRKQRVGLVLLLLSLALIVICNIDRTQPTWLYIVYCAGAAYGASIFIIEDNKKG